MPEYLNFILLDIQRFKYPVILYYIMQQFIRENFLQQAKLSWSDAEWVAAQELLDDVTAENCREDSSW